MAVFFLFTVGCLLLLCNVKEFVAASGLSAPSLQVDYSNVFDPMKSLEPRAPLSELFGEVLKTLTNLESLPTCQQNAAKHLVRLCASPSSLQKPNVQTSDAVVEQLLVVFAIRWSGCEFAASGHSMPRACKPLLDQSLSDVTAMHAKTQPCMHAILHDRTNSNSLWVSFQKARDHTGIMCHALRSGLDKDEMMHDFKTLLNQFSHMSVMVEVSKDEAEKLQSQFREIREGMNDIFITLREDQKEAQSQLQESLSRIQDQVTNKISGMGMDLQKLLDTMQVASTGLTVYESMVGQAFNRTSELGSAINTLSVLSLGQIRDEVQALLSELKFQADFAAKDLFKDVYDITNDLGKAHDLSAAIRSSLRDADAGVVSQALQIGVLNKDISIFAAHQQAAHDQVMNDYKAIDTLTEQSRSAMEKLTETLETAAEIIQDPLKIITDFVANTFGYTAVLMFWFCITASLTIAAFLGFGYFSVITTFVALLMGAVLSIFFTFIISPISYFSSVVKTYPRTTFLLPAIAVVFTAGLLLGLGVERLRFRNLDQEHVEQDSSDHYIRSDWRYELPSHKV